ncbi:ataxin-7-like protein 2 isoform X1 [Sinocyclocheilus grahami]|uniref:Ataxin-7-like protein 2 n=1 Tax=Sinocyclocheilus grahami TaxID=75366 RepID=A0A672KHX1_SINGR|nr:PREDICTED: ataxin-7-like protein 2 isoform X1 [Sinocyclocheilus grahami]
MTSQCAPVVMVADRARAKSVMAALDRRISIADFVGQSWAAWIDRANVSTPEGSCLEECSKNVKKRMETMTLKKEDMSIYGHCPAHDDFFLVVCSHCGQVVKPQAFEKHCERRHGLFSELYNTPSNCSPNRPQHGRPPSQHGSLCEVQDSRHQGAGPPRVPPPHYPHQRHSKPHREGISFQQVDKVSRETPPSPLHLPTPPKKAAPSVMKPIQKSLDSHTHPHGPRTYSRTYNNVLKKECDLDKHCGVMDPERKKLCTRLLTCNIHSIHQRRQVVGRRKPFDQLVMELKMSSKPRERPPLPREVPDEGSTHHETPASQIGPLHYKCQITNSSILRSMNSAEGVIEMKEEVMRSEEPQAESSEESDGENCEDFAHLPGSTLHPKPLGLCTFGARVLGRSVLAFDRRLLHLRSAFCVMMEQHLSTYLWKKIPQVSELCSHQPLNTTNTYNSHDATRSSLPIRSASTLRTSTSGQSEPTNLTAASKLPTKAQTTSGPARPRNPAGRTSKQALQAGFRELQESPTANKHRKSPKEDKDLPGQSKILFLPHHKDRQSSLNRTTISSPHGPFNGAHSLGSRTHPPEMKGLIKQSSAHISPSPSPESDKGGASGLNQRAVGYEHKGPGRKRKTCDASPPKNNSCPPKPNILSSFSQTHSSLVSWGGDGRPASTSHSLPKKLGAQKVCLTHLSVV